MKQLTHITLLSLLLLVAGTFSVSAQFVDNQGKYVNMWFDSTMDSIRRLFLYDFGLNVSDTITNVQSHPMNDTLENVGNICQVQNVERIEEQKTIGELYGRMQMLCQLLKNNIRMGLQIILGLLMLICFVVTCVGLMTKKDKLKTQRKQILLIICIVSISLYSDSHWAYLALVMLCVLKLFNFNSKLQQQFSKLLKAYAGSPEKEEATEQDIEQKEAKDEQELLQMGENESISKSTKNDDKNNISSQKEKLNDEKREVKRLAFHYLRRQYPSLQMRYITYKTGLFGRFTYDCFVEKEDSVLLIEIKYNPSPRFIYDVSPLYLSAELFNRQNKRKFMLLLFIVTNNIKNKQKLLEYYNEQSHEENYIQVKVFTKNELKNI